MTDLIDRAALVEFMERILRNLETNADVSASYLRGYREALAEVKQALPARVPQC